jgi:lysophospholipase L1-like esterase
MWNHSPMTRSFKLISSLALSVALASMVGMPLAAQDHSASPPLALQPQPQTDDWAKDWWMPRHKQKLEERAALKECQLLWIGDSITHGWEDGGRAIWEERYAPLGALNLGFSGDRTEQVLWRLQEGEVEGIAPKVTVIMIGTNNTGHRMDAAEATSAGIEAILASLKERLPDTKILLLGIFPRGNDAKDPARQLNEKINAIISTYADGQRVHYLDIGKRFLNPDGTLMLDVMPDALHPNESGYQLWADAIDSTLQPLLKQESK